MTNNVNLTYIISNARVKLISLIKEQNEVKSCQSVSKILHAK